MKALDTNVLLRYLVQDDPAQHREAAKLILEAEHRHEQIFLSLLVVCEAVWVLEYHYRYSRAAILSVLDVLLETEVFSIEQPELARACVERLRTGKTDFADYVIGELARQAGCSTTYTFDRGLRGAPNFHVL